MELFSAVNLRRNICKQTQRQKVEAETQSQYYVDRQVDVLGSKWVP